MMYFEENAQQQFSFERDLTLKFHTFRQAILSLFVTGIAFPQHHVPFGSYGF